MVVYNERSSGLGRKWWACAAALVGGDDEARVESRDGGLRGGGVDVRASGRKMYGEARGGEAEV